MSEARRTIERWFYGPAVGEWSFGYRPYMVKRLDDGLWGVFRKARINDYFARRIKHATLDAAEAVVADLLAQDGSHDFVDKDGRPYRFESAEG